MAQGKAKLAIERFGFAAKKPERTVYNTSGWIVAVSINQAAPSSRRLLTQCFAGTRTQPGVMSISQMFQLVNTPDPLSFFGNRLLVEVSGLLEVGRSKNFLLLHRS